MFKLSKGKHINLAKIYKKSNNLIDLIPFFKKRRRRKKIFKLLKYLIISFVGFFLVIIILFGNSIINLTYAYRETLNGENNLKYTAKLIKKQEFVNAIIYSTKAKKNFSTALFKIDTIQDNFLISNFSLVNEQINKLYYLIKTAEILSYATFKGSTMALNIEETVQGKNKDNFSKFSDKEKRDVLKIIYESGPELNGINANLKLALINLKKIKLDGFIKPYKNKINDLKNQIETLLALTSKMSQASEILPILAGYPNDAKYLVIMQNNSELRPTGGFIGTYGILKTKNGNILSFDTHDIYHMDMPVKDKLNITPPDPIKKYLGVDKWYMRDSNWSPDWPTSAQKIEWFYNKENSLLSSNQKAKTNFSEFNGVIGITPQFVIDLLKITGPIIINEEEFNKNNFMELLQYKVEKNYVKEEKSEWDRKKIIGKILEELKIKLFDLPSSKWIDIFNVINNNLLNKEILIYLKDEQLQNSISDLGWSGEIQKVNGDYLMIVDSNMAALKTDLVMNKGINYKLEENSNGLFSKLKINYAHHGNFDWKTSRYRTYVRVYVPFGSKLIKSIGISEGEIITGNELGKTYFGAFVSIEPQEIGSLYLEYKLPNNILEQIKNGQYELFVQKQPGNKIKELSIDLNFKKDIELHNPTGFFVKKIKTNKIKWETDLNLDKKFNISF